MTDNVIDLEEAKAGIVFRAIYDTLEDQDPAQFYILKKDGECYSINSNVA